MTHSETEVLAARVRGLRIAQGLSQEDLARLADVSRSTVQNLETGRRTTRPRLLTRIAQALKTDVPSLRSQDGGLTITAEMRAAVARSGMSEREAAELFEAFRAANDLRAAQ